MANFKEKVNLATRKNVTNDLGKTWIKNDEKVVQRYSSIIKSWQNPFEKREGIVRFSLQVEAPTTVNKLCNFDTAMVTKIMKVTKMSK